MRSFPLKSRSGFGRPLHFESLETRRLLTGVAHGAAFAHVEPAEAAEVGKADPSGSKDAKGSGAHVEGSKADHVSSTSHTNVHASLDGTGTADDSGATETKTTTETETPDNSGR